MLNDAIAAVIKTTAAGLSYAFYTGPEQMTAATLRHLPAVWLSPIVMMEGSGRRERTEKYKVIIRLMRSGNMDEAIRSEVMLILNRHLKKISDALFALPFICKTEQGETTAGEYMQTPYGELSVKTELILTAKYINE